MNINYMVNKDCTSWEKALYHFTKNLKYPYVWFFEDDVFFRKEKELMDIDQQYPNQNLISAPGFMKTKDNLNWMHWTHRPILHDEPHYGGMCCIVRMSQDMLKRIENVAKKHMTLYFLEVLFPTEGHDTTYAEPPELKTINLDNHQTFLPGNIYHPVKDISRHLQIRES